MPLDVLSTLIIGLACDACDGFLGVPGLGRGMRPSPFAVDTCTIPDTFIDSDPWPTAGEVRRNTFSRSCVDIDMTRSFVSSERGFAPDELFVLTTAKTSRAGRALRELTHREFIGSARGWTYRYTLSLGEDGKIEVVSGSVDERRLPSLLVEAYLTPDSRFASTTAFRIECDLKAQRCEVWPDTVEAVSQRPLSIYVGKGAPDGGDLCVSLPASSRVQLEADGTALPTGFGDSDKDDVACLADASATPLAKLKEAEVVTYRINHISRERTFEMKGQGLDIALSLAGFFRGTEFLNGSAASAAQQTEATARQAEAN